MTKVRFDWTAGSVIEVQLGGGNDRLQVSGMYADNRVLYSGGRGSDTLARGPDLSVFAMPPTIRSFEYLVPVT